MNPITHLDANQTLRVQMQKDRNHMNTNQFVTVGATAFVVAFVGITPCAAHDQPTFTFTDIIVPGGEYPSAFGINNEGTIVGNFLDVNNPNLVGGFVLRKDLFTDVFLPASVTTEAWVQGINDLGTGVGPYFDSVGQIHSFLRTARGEIVYLPDAVASGAAPFTSIGRINNNNVAVGSAGADLNNGSTFHGCLLHGGHYTLFDFPGAFGTYCEAINDHDQMVGWYLDAKGTAHGFLREGDHYRTVDVPGALFTNVLGINNRGQMVGGYGSAADNYVWHGFLLSAGVFTTVDFPGQEETGNVLWMINDHGEGVGTYANSNGAFSVTVLPPKCGKQSERR